MKVVKKKNIGSRSLLPSKFQQSYLRKIICIRLSVKGTSFMNCRSFINN